MPEPTPTPTPTPPPTPDPAQPGEGQEPTFKQADVDRIVADRLKRERDNTKAKYADYDDLKQKAGQAQTVEQQLAGLREELTATKVEATRASIAARFSISTERGENGEPSDADLFLTGTDEETLTAQAQRLAARESDRSKNGNHVPPEGDNSRPAPDAKREFLRSLKGD